MQIPQDRIEVARRTAEGLAATVAASRQPWQVKFRKGCVAFQRDRGHNVILVDLYWNRPVRLAIKLPAGCSPASLGLSNPSRSSRGSGLDTTTSGAGRSQPPTPSPT